MLPKWFPQHKVKHLGRFRNFYKLAEGGYGEIFSAEMTSPANDTSIRVAIKRFKPIFSPKDSERKEKFLNEARILKSLNHPGIPAYRDGFVSDSECFYIMDFIEGLDLDRAIRHGKLAKLPPDPTFAFYIVNALLTILEYLHAKNFIHGDLKLKNLMVQKDLNVRLIDFSATIPLGSKKFIGGTPAYSPLECFTGGSPSFASDLFSTSVLLFNLLTFERLNNKAETPYDHFAHLAENLHLERVRSKGFPDPLQQLLIQGLANDPLKRFFSASEFRDRLSRFANSLTSDTFDRQRLGEFWSKLSRVD